MGFEGDDRPTIGDVLGSVTFHPDGPTSAQAHRQTRLLEKIYKELYMLRIGILSVAREKVTEEEWERISAMMNEWDDIIIKEDKQEF